MVRANDSRRQYKSRTDQEQANYTAAMSAGIHSLFEKSPIDKAIQPRTWGQEIDVKLSIVQEVRNKVQGLMGKKAGSHAESSEACCAARGGRSKNREAHFLHTRTRRTDSAKSRKLCRLPR